MIKKKDKANLKCKKAENTIAHCLSQKVIDTKMAEQSLTDQKNNNKTLCTSLEVKDADNANISCANQEVKDVDKIINISCANNEVEDADKPINISDANPKMEDANKETIVRANCPS